MAAPPSRRVPPERERRGGAFLSKKGSLENERTMILNMRALAALAVLSVSAAACAAPTDAVDVPEVEETNQDLVSRSAYFETFEGLDGQYHFNLVAGNGQNVLRSEGYTRLASAEQGVASVLANGTRTANFHLLQADSGDWYFNLEAYNGEIIGTSELYASKSNAQRGASTVRALVRLIKAPAVTQAAPREERFEIFGGEDGKTYFRFRAKNGEIMLASQAYTAKSSAKKGISSVALNGSDEENFEITETPSGTFAIRLVAQNHEVIARGEAYASKSNAQRAIARLASIFTKGDIAISE